MDSSNAREPTDKKTIYGDVTPGPNDKTPVPQPRMAADVLLVTDTAEDPDGIDLLLEEAGYTVKVRRAERAFDEIMAATPGVIIVNMSPSDPRLLSLLEETSNRLASMAPPAIVLTNAGDETALRAIMASGVRDVLSKPVLPALLKVKISQHMRAPLSRHEPIGGYEIRRLLGTGGMGAVYLAERDGKKVALKVLHLANAEADPEAIARFRREADILKSLAGHGAPEFYELGRTTKLFYCAMEFLLGDTLYDRLERRGPLNTRDLVGLLVDVSGALEMIHARGLVHRDVKPNNVVMTQQGGVKLIDFGLAKNAGDNSLTSSNIIMGTANYISPELASGDGEPTPQSDAFALGMTAFEAALGFNPERGTPFDIISRHAKGIVPDANAMLAAVPPDIRDVIKRLVEVDPEKRLTLAAVGPMLRTRTETATDATPGPAP